MSAKRPLRADAQRNRDHVLDVANQVFASEGLGVPIDEIARRAGLGIGTLYRHFPTKEALFIAIAIRRLEQVAADARALEKARDPGAAFFAFFAKMIADAPAKKDLMQAIAATGFDARRTAAKAEIGRAVGKLLSRAQAAGAVRPDIEVGEVFALMHGVHDAMDSPGRTPESRARMVAVMFDGLRPTKKRAASPRRAISSRLG